MRHDPGREPRRPGHGLPRYLAPQEQVLYESRQHVMVLADALLAWMVAVALGLLAARLARTVPRTPSGREAGPWLAPIGSVLILLGTAYFWWRVGRWWTTRSLITNERILHIEGIVSRKVTALPLRLVIDTTYRRSVAGRVFGYGDLEVNLSGQPGLRTLHSIPRPGKAYGLITSLLSTNAEPAPRSTGDAGVETHPLLPIGEPARRYRRVTRS